MRRSPASPYPFIALLLASVACSAPADSTGKRDTHSDATSAATQTDADAEPFNDSAGARAWDTSTASAEDASGTDAAIDTTQADSQTPDAASQDIVADGNAHQADIDTTVTDTDNEDDGALDTLSQDTTSPDVPVVADSTQPDTTVADVIQVDTTLVDVGQPDSTQIDTAKQDVGDPKVCPFGQTTKDLGCGFQGVCKGNVSITCYADTPTCDYSKALDWQALETECDGKDNDCDGYTDNNLATPPATTWPVTGVCSKALQVCGGATGWQEPIAWQVPNYEVSEVSCDGLDNDCDGITDADIQAKPPLSSGAGVCGGLTMQCLGGVWTPPKPSTAPDWEVIELSCDGLDNDCDGKTDEGLVPPKSLPGNNLLLSKGVCAGAKPVCVGGIWKAPDYHAFAAGQPSEVTLTYEPVEKSCDGLDNDCNGKVDDALQSPLANNQKGVCAGAQKVCNGSWGEPNYFLIPGYNVGPELVCDGLDNDCDGKTDEDIACPIWQIGGTNAGGMVTVGDHVAWAAGASVFVHHKTTGKRVVTHRAHQQPVLGVALSPEGSALATVGAGQVLRIRPLLGGSAGIVALDAPGKTWTSLAFDPVSKRLATADSVGWLRLLALPSGTTTIAKKAHTGPVRQMHWLQGGPFNGVRLFTGDELGKFVAWQPNTLVTSDWTPSFVSATSGPVRGIAANPKGTLVAVAWQNAGVVILGTEKGAVLGGPLLPGKAVSAVAFDGNGRLWVGNDAGALRRYQVAQMGPPGWKLDWSIPATKTLPAPGAINTIVPTLAGPLMISGRKATGIRTLQGAWLPLGAPLPFSPAAVDSTTERWAIVGTAGQARVGSWVSGASLWSGDVHSGTNVSAVALKSITDKPNIATATATGLTRVAHLSGSAPVKESAVGWASAPVGLQRLSWHQGVLYRGVGNQVTGIDDNAGFGKPPPAGVKALFSFTLPSGIAVHDVAVDGAGQHIVVANSGTNDQLRLIELATGKQLWSRGGLAASLHRVVWRPDGSELLVTGGGTGAQVLATKSGKTLFGLPGHLKVVTAIAWSGNGTRLLTASRDGAVRLWRRTASGVVGIATSIRHCAWPCSDIGGVVDLRFRTASGSEWLTVGADGGVIGWRLP